LFGGDEIQPSDELTRFADAVFTVHVGILKFYREGPTIAHFVECRDDGLEINRAAPRQANFYSPITLLGTPARSSWLSPPRRKEKRGSALSEAL